MSKKVEEKILKVAIEIVREGKGALFVIGNKVKYEKLFSQTFQKFSIFDRGAEKLVKGVLGHELSHIANYDIKFMTLVAVMVGLIAIISEIFLRSLWYKGGGNDNKKGNAILLIIGILLAILAPILVSLVQLAISRKREYAADASSVKFTRYPRGLISALKKIKNEHIEEQDKKRISKAVAPLFISNPFKNKIRELSSTHPPIEKRIEILERM